MGILWTFLPILFKSLGWTWEIKKNWQKLLLSSLLTIGLVLYMTMEYWGMWIFLSIFTFGLPFVFFFLGFGLVPLLWETEWSKKTGVFYYFCNFSAWSMFMGALFHTGIKQIDTSGSGGTPLPLWHRILTPLILGVSLIAYQMVFAHHLNHDSIKKDKES